MSAANPQTVRIHKPSARRQAKAVAREIGPLGLLGSWEDMVAVASMAALAATIVFLFVVG